MRLMDLLPEEVQVAAALPPPVRRRGRDTIDEGPLTGAQAMNRLSSAREDWKEPLTWRKSIEGTWTEEQATQFEQRQNSTRKRTFEKFCPNALPDESVDENGNGLPPAKRSCLAADWQRYCLSGSWAM
eukprot:4992703-Karenia_brevis.AAC.1